MKKNISLLLILTAMLLFTSCMMTRSMRREQEQANHRAPKNLIVMIVDGMGFEHVKAARIFNGMKPFSYEQFPCKTTVTHLFIRWRGRTGQLH